MEFISKENTTNMNLTTKILSYDLQVSRIFDTIKRYADFYSIEEISEFENQIVKLQEEYSNMFSSSFSYVKHQRYKNILLQIKDIMLAKTPHWYKIPVTLNNEEFVNGYQLYNLKEEYDKPLLSYSDFKELEKIYNTPNTMTKEEFLEYSKENYELKNDGEALYNLPYSHALIFKTIEYRIFKTIEIGSNNGIDLVRFSNSLCEYVKRKLSKKVNEKITTSFSQMGTVGVLLDETYIKIKPVRKNMMSKRINHCGRTVAGPGFEYMMCEGKSAGNYTNITFFPPHEPGKGKLLFQINIMSDFSCKDGFIEKQPKIYKLPQSTIPAIEFVEIKRKRKKDENDKKFKRYKKSFERIPKNIHKIKNQRKYHR